jgi:hypothetical protein
MLLVKYEEFVADKPGAIDNLRRRLGLRRARSIDAVMDVPFQPAASDRRPWDEFFGDNLLVIEHTCATRMRAFGYPPAGQVQTARQPGL